MIGIYQLIILGNKINDSNEIIQQLKNKLYELHISKNVIKLIDSNNIQDLSIKHPAICLYFGNEKKSDITIIDNLLSQNILILPLVSDLREVPNEIPDNLSTINCFEFNTQNKIPEIVNIILEKFELLPQKRKIFISYKRSDSTKVALQLYSFLNENGFSPFLDSFSIRPMLNFQEELKNYMVDCDLILLLDTKNFFDSKWTIEEFNQANALSIGIIRLIWSDTDRSKYKDSECSLFENIELKKEDFTNENFTANGRFKKSSLNTIKMQIEMFRARSIQFRQSNIIGEISKYAKTQEKNIIQLDNYLQIKENVDILIIPTLGIPNSENFNSARKFLDEPHNKKQLYLLYDNRNILKSWLNYLDWINKYNIPIKTVKVSNLEELGW
ncbi:MAG: toll/interleukin-1 receptor domain-containing protein [Spirochaetaceae bacterium]|nr:toll/interleukin-1 receptor domain-containing protein [Spirochaetaceae bacterium]